MSDATPLLDENASKGPAIPRAVAAPVEAALATVGGLATSGASQATERGMSVASRARPWLEFVDFSAFGLASGGVNEYVTRFRANLRWFLLNYVLIGFGMAAISVVTKPLALLGAILLIWVYFQLFGAATEGQEEVAFFGLMLDAREKAGLMVVLSVVVFWFAAGGLNVLVSILMGTIVIALVHGCLRTPHPDALTTEGSVV